VVGIVKEGTGRVRIAVEELALAIEVSLPS